MPSKIRSHDQRGDDNALSARLLAQARSFIRLCLLWEQSQSRSPVLRSLSLYPPSATRNGQWLVVAKVWDDGQRKVGFHRSPDPLTALLGALTKLSQGSLTLKDDTYSEG